MNTRSSVTLLGGIALVALSTLLFTNNAHAGNTCPAGQYYSGGCVTCLAGNYCDGVSAALTPCPAGTYNTLTGQDNVNDCQLCATGTYNALTGQDSPTDCIDCATGTYNPNNGGDSAGDCLACPAGTEQPTAGSNGCNDCSTGEYSGTGAANCSACLAGSYEDEEGSPACNLCPVDTYNEISGSDSALACLDCADGTYSDEGSDDASDCAAPGSGSGCSSDPVIPGGPIWMLLSLVGIVLLISRRLQARS